MGEKLKSKREESRGEENRIEVKEENDNKVQVVGLQIGLTYIKPILVRPSHVVRNAGVLWNFYERPDEKQECSPARGEQKEEDRGPNLQMEEDKRRGHAD